MKKTHMLLIDCQNDFCSPQGSLFVTGADQDMSRLSNLIDRLGNKITDIHATLDSHQPIQIFFESYWRDSNGNHPAPFTMIGVEDVEKRTWTPVIEGARQRSLDYVKSLRDQGKYCLLIWPYHTIIGSWGASLVPSVSDSLVNWCKIKRNKVDFCIKGDNPFTEMFSVFKAEVPDNADPNTTLNGGLIERINAADEILIAGEALSHCVKSSVEDLINEVGESFAKKFVFLQDASSSVTGFEKNGEDFIKEMKKIGMRFTTTTDYLA